MENVQPSVPRPKRQHWLPQFYLRYFAVPGTDNIWVFRRERDTIPFIAGIKNICCQKYLYSPSDADGNRDFHVEQQLSDLESLLAPLWQRMNEGLYDFASEGAKKGISLFIANLMLRHPGKITEIKAVHQKMVSFFDSCPKDENGVPKIGNVFHKGVGHEFDPSDWSAYKNAGDLQHHRFFVDMIQKETFYFAELLYRKPWRMLYSKIPVYVTSDQPVILVNTEREVFGINTPGTTIYFPISPTRVLVIDDRIAQDGLYRPDRESNGASTNFTVWTHTDGFMLSSRESHEVLFEIFDVYDEYKELQNLREYRKSRRV